VVVERRSAGDAGGSAFDLKPFKDPLAEIEARGWRVEARRVRHPGFGGSRRGSGGGKQNAFCGYARASSSSWQHATASSNRGQDKVRMRW
jgi:hypothetical protein